jgi:hypothetical protein
MNMTQQLESLTEVYGPHVDENKVLNEEKLIDLW